MKLTFYKNVPQESQKVQDKTYLVRQGKAEDHSETKDAAGTREESLQVSVPSRSLNRTFYTSPAWSLIHPLRQI